MSRSHELITTTEAKRDCGRATDHGEEAWNEAAERWTRIEGRAQPSTASRQDATAFVINARRCKSCGHAVKRALLPEAISPCRCRAVHVAQPDAADRPTGSAQGCQPPLTGVVLFEQNDRSAIRRVRDMPRDIMNKRLADQSIAEPPDMTHSFTQPRPRPSEPELHQGMGDELHIAGRSRNTETDCYATRPSREQPMASVHATRQTVIRDRTPASA